MTVGTTVIVIAGIVAALLLGIALGFDAGAVVILALIVACGATAVGVARKSRSGAVSPAVCHACGGLVSPNAPYCKHCGEPSERASYSSDT